MTEIIPVPRNLHITVLRPPSISPPFSTTVFHAPQEAVDFSPVLCYDIQDGKYRTSPIGQFETILTGAARPQIKTKETKT